MNPLILADELRASRERLARITADLDGDRLLGPKLAIVNPPQVAILALGAFRDRLFLDGDRLVARPTARLTLSGDHRAIDGADAARFLAELRRRIETGVTSLST